MLYLSVQFKKVQTLKSPELRIEWIFLVDFKRDWIKGEMGNTTGKGRGYPFHCDLWICEMSVLCGLTTKGRRG